MVADRWAGRRAKSTRCQESEDGILGEVRDLSGDEMDDRESFWSGVREQPEY